MRDKILKFLKSTFSEADGSASASRVLAGSTILATLGWVTYLVFLNHSLPDLGGNGSGTRDMLPNRESPEW